MAWRTSELGAGAWDYVHDRIIRDLDLGDPQMEGRYITTKGTSHMSQSIIRI